MLSDDYQEYQVTSLAQNKQYAFKMTAVNAKGQSEYSAIRYQYAGAIPTLLTAPTLIQGTRTKVSVGIQMYVPGISTTDVLGYQLFINMGDSNSIPDQLAYDGQDISNILAVTV